MSETHDNFFVINLFGFFFSNACPLLCISRRSSICIRFGSFDPPNRKFHKALLLHWISLSLSLPLLIYFFFLCTRSSSICCEHWMTMAAKETEEEEERRGSYDIKEAFPVLSLFVRHHGRNSRNGVASRKKSSVGLALNRVLQQHIQALLRRQRPISKYFMEAAIIMWFAESPSAAPQDQ